MNPSPKMPSVSELYLPIMHALDTLGGSGTKKEIDSTVITEMNLPEELTEILHNEKYSSTQTEIGNRLAWARTHLKKCKLIENSDNGVWSFTSNYKKGIEITPSEISKNVQKTFNRKNNKAKINNQNKEDIEIIEDFSVREEERWKNQLHKILLNLAPDAFERLCNRILRESGFEQVEVTGRSGDGGIDGKGILKLQNIITFHVVFQCKRYKDSVSSPAIRNFRGAMQGRADKGIFITTGSFTQEAEREACRDGATTIDLINGEELCEMLKSLRLGVTVKMVEQVEISEDWFNNI